MKLALLAGWGAARLVTLGPIPGIIGLMAAKHVLVALLLARPPEEQSGEDGGEERRPAPEPAAAARLPSVRHVGC